MDNVTVTPMNPNVAQVIARHRECVSETTVTYTGREFVMMPNVFCPLWAPSGRLGLAFASMPMFYGKRVLDIGCGSGIVACLMAMHGASTVVAGDICDCATRNAVENVRRFSLNKSVKVRQGDLLDIIEKHERFDYVFADLPFCDGNPRDELEKAFFSPKLSIFSRFLHLFSQGAALQRSQCFLCTSDLEDLDLPRHCIESGLAISPFIAVQLPWIKLKCYRIEHGA